MPFFGHFGNLVNQIKGLKFLTFGTSLNELKHPIINTTSQLIPGFSRPGLIIKAFATLYDWIFLTCTIDQEIDFQAKITRQ